jgi:hypothetical protein
VSFVLVLSGRASVECRVVATARGAAVKNDRRTTKKIAAPGEGGAARRGRQVSLKNTEVRVLV